MIKFDITTVWIVSGILLVVGEMLTASFFLLFIALGSFAAALMSSLGASYFQQASVCAVISVAGMVLLRKPLQRKLLKGININADVGNEIQVDHAMPPHKQSRIGYQGTTWQALNLDTEEIKKGDRVVIVGIDGNVLLIRKVT